MVVKGGKLVEAPVPEGVTKVGPGAAELNKAAGKNQATAQTALPKMIASEAETNDIVGGMLGHPQQGYAVGYGGLTPSLPNVNSDYLSRIERLKGMTFLNAVPELKGFGALSNSEGDKLSAAKSRAADRRLTPEDHTEALLEVQHYQRLATERIKQMAQGRFNANNPDEYNRNILEGQAPTQYQIYQKAKKALKEGADPADVRALITKWGYDPGKWRM
jgi:hypothetical protein